MVVVVVVVIIVAAFVEWLWWRSGNSGICISSKLVAYFAVAR